MTQKRIGNRMAKEAGIRLNKYISDAGICSRREADRYVEAGRVKINDHVASLGEKILPGDVVYVDGKKVEEKNSLTMIVFNKPVGVECTCDRSNPDNIIDYLHYPERLIYVGRLDKNSHGLLLMTNDGDLSNKIAKSCENHEKEYVVKVNRPITEEFLTGMRKGVPILNTVTKPCRVEPIDEDTFRIVLTQGLNRQIRRMTKVFGYTVVDLKRIRVMNIKLENVKEGTYRKATKEEIDILFGTLGID